MRYARFVAAFAAFVLLFWSGGGLGGLIAPCLLFQLLANDVHACVCVCIFIYVYRCIYTDRYTYVHRFVHVYEKQEMKLLA